MNVAGKAKPCLVSGLEIHLVVGAFFLFSLFLLFSIFCFAFSSALLFIFVVLFSCESLRGVIRVLRVHMKMYALSVVVCYISLIVVNP